METYQASENMQKFFEKLLALKKFVRHKLDEQHDETLEQILMKLNEIIKEKGEAQ